MCCTIGRQALLKEGSTEIYHDVCLRPLMKAILITFSVAGFMVQVRFRLTLFLSKPESCDL